MHMYVYINIYVYTQIYIFNVVSFSTNWYLRFF